MSVTDMTGASDAEFEARIAPFEADERVETVARALWKVDYPRYPWNSALDGDRRRYRRLAAAAIAALPPSPAELALQRVEALVEEFDSATLPPLINDFDRGLVAGYARAAARIRAALASPAPAPQGEDELECTCGPYFDPYCPAHGDPCANIP